MIYLAFILAFFHGLQTLFIGPNPDATVVVLATEGLIALGCAMDWAESRRG